MARLEPLPHDEWSPDLTSFIAEFRTSVIGDKAKESGGPQSGVNLLGTLALSPELTKPFLTFNGHFLYGTSLSARQRELIVLRVAVLRHCQYEWAQHRLLAREAGVTAEEIAQVIEGPDGSGWTPIEAALLRSVDELIGKGLVSDETWKVLAAEFDVPQLMDVVFTVGTYEMVAFAIRSFGVELEPDLAATLADGQ
jgi:AhpD family alkylhydroperoxidase